MASRTLKPHDEVELVTTSMCISERMDLSCSVREKAHGLRDQVLLQQGLEGLEDCFSGHGRDLSMSLHGDHAVAAVPE